MGGGGREGLGGPTMRNATWMAAPSPVCSQDAVRLSARKRTQRAPDKRADGAINGRSASKNGGCCPHGGEGGLWEGRGARADGGEGVAERDGAEHAAVRRARELRDQPRVGAVVSAHLRWFPYFSSLMEFKERA